MDKEELNQHSLSVSNYGYSAVGVDSLGATEYTLVTIVVDESGSVDSFKTEMEACLTEVFKACQKSPRADNLLLRIVAFSNDVREIQGFKPLMECNENDFKDCLTIRDATALTDASINAIEAEANYGRQLVSNDFSVNGIVVIITDGCDNRSTNNIDKLAKVIGSATGNKGMETLVSILVGVNMSNCQGELDKFSNDGGLTQFIGIEDASSKTLAKLAKFISSSVVSQSQALGTGSVGNRPLEL